MSVFILISKFHSVLKIKEIYIDFIFLWGYNVKDNQLIKVNCKMKRVLISLLIIISVLLQSCGLVVVNERPNKQTEAVTGDDTSPSDVTEDGEKEKPTPENLEKKAEYLLKKLPDISFEKQVITIYTADDTFFSGDGQETVLNSDRIARIKKVEEKFNLSFRTVETAPAAAYDEVAAAYKTDTAPGHIFALPADVTVSLIAGGYLKSLRTSPYFDENAEYFNSSVSAFTLGNDIFAVSGDGCFEPDKISALYYNKTDMDALGLDPISKLVKNGDWTIDKFHEYLTAAEAYDGSLSINKTEFEHEDILLLSSFTFAENVIDEPVRLSSFGEKFKGVCQSIAKHSEISVGKDGDFTEGNILFLTDSLAAAEKFADMKDVWSVAPHPKYSKEDGYMSFISPDAVVLSMPDVTGSSQEFGAVIMGLNAASSGYVLQKYINTNMNHFLRDNSAVTAFDIIIKNVNYDFAYIFSGTYTTLNKYTLGAFSSILNGKLTHEQYVEKYEKESGEYLDKHFPAKYY